MTTGPSSECKVQYTAWSQALETYVTLITDLQRFEKTKPLVLWAAALRYSKPFIEHFVKQGSPWYSVNRVMIDDDHLVVVGHLLPDADELVTLHGEGVEANVGSLDPDIGELKCKVFIVL